MAPIYVDKNEVTGPHYVYKLLNSVSIRASSVTDINLCYSEKTNKLWFTCSRTNSQMKRNMSYLTIRDLNEVEDLIYKLCYHRLYTPKSYTFSTSEKKFIYDKCQHTFRIEPIHSRYEYSLSIFDDCRDYNNCIKKFNDNLDIAYKDIMPKFIEFMFNYPDYYRYETE